MPWSASATEDLLAVVAGRLAAGEDGAQRRHVHGALLTRARRGTESAVGTPRVERAAAGDVRQVRRLPDDRLQPPALGLDLRDRVHQAFGVRMCGAAEDVVDRAG